ncbi:MAG: HEAT repeat domain-containing protein [Candidatus Electrothrix sp. GW3-4]|uniref:HEAT repeat domain-containing protein n=1 Tax=Candidatus Electrothrix sp. GW3-4 TaxID=3126740 RepID=UPI0030CD921F
MENNDSSSHSGILKGVSTFFSSVVIASASIVVTLTYNSKKLEITNKQAVSQMEIASIKEISKLIPQLGSENAKERKFSAITLSLYGKDAVPALIALLDDEEIEVRNASSKALSLIGEPAVLELETAFKDRQNSANLRGSAIYTLGRMKSRLAIPLALETVADSSENKIIRKDAANALGMLRSTQGIPVLLKAIQSTSNTILVEAAVWALGEIGDKKVTEQLATMLTHQSSRVRMQAVWALTKLEDETTIPLLQKVLQEDTSLEVRDAAINALEWMK